MSREVMQQARDAEYENLMRECCQVAGPADWYWNERFVSALTRRGLTLATARHPNDQDAWYPNGYPMQSPLPYTGPGAWPVGALVVWAIHSSVIQESIRAELAKGDGWIKCTDRMPEKGTPVLIFTHEKTICLAEAVDDWLPWKAWRIVGIDADDWEWEWDGQTQDGSPPVTHWRPLPMPPT